MDPEKRNRSKAHALDIVTTLVILLGTVGGAVLINRYTTSPATITQVVTTSVGTLFFLTVLYSMASQLVGPTIDRLSNAGRENTAADASD